jgi:hypothetical protein
MILLVLSFLVYPKITIKADRHKYDAYWSALFIHRDFSQMGISPSKRIVGPECTTIALHIGNPFTPDTKKQYQKCPSIEMTRINENFEMTIQLYII